MRQPDLSQKSKTMITDGIEVTEEEAFMLAVNHALLAARFFEAVPADFPHRELKVMLALKHPGLETDSILNFFRSLDAAYAKSGI